MQPVSLLKTLSDLDCDDYYDSEDLDMDDILDNYYGEKRLRRKKKQKRSKVDDYDT